MHSVSVEILELKRTAVTDQSGHYEFTDIPAGKYTVHAHQEGFSEVSQKVELTAGGGAVADFAMSLSGLKEQVTVTASGTEQSTFEAIASVATLDSSQITTRAAVGLGQLGHRRRQSRGRVLERQLEQHLDLPPPRRPGKRAAHVGDRVEARRRGERSLGRERRLLDPVDSEGAEVVAAVVEGGEVPAAGVDDEPERAQIAP